VTWSDFWWILAVIPAGFIQNMAFTWTSRSRNSADIWHHAKAAVGSNGVWLICNGLVMRGWWDAFQNANWWGMGLMAVFYTVATVAGSCTMMAANLGHFKGHKYWNFLDILFGEKGKQQVGKR
jgi:hypothetical protein